MTSMARILIPFCLVVAFADSGFTDDGNGRNFRQIVQSHNKAAIQSVIKYVEEHPDAADRAAAYRWLFETALNEGLEADVTELAGDYLDQADESDELQGLALSARCLGLTRAGKSQEALEIFEQIVRASRFRPSNALLDLAEAIATRAQMNNDLAAAKSAYEILSGAFFLNETVKEFCALRLGKLEMVGKKAPSISGMALGGHAVDTANDSGKVILVDFWSTNCAPCLAAFPAMKQIYADNHEKGFKIVGISLDEDTRIVEDFQQRWKLPWPLIVDQPQIDEWRSQYQAKKIPSTYLVDKTGKIVKVDLSGDDLRRAVEELLNAD